MTDEQTTGALRLDDLPAEVLDAISAARFDRIIEKHEGPWPWEYWVRDSGGPGRVEFLTIAGHAVLLPVEREAHASLSVLRAVFSADDQLLVLFLRDARAVEWYGGETFASRLALCERWPGWSFYVCHTYHEWYRVGPATDDWPSPRGTAKA